MFQLAFILCLSATYAHASYDHWYQKVQNQNLFTTPWDDEEWDADTFRGFLEKVHERQMQPPPMQVRKNSFEIINRVYKRFNLDHDTIIPETQSWEDIYLFHAKEPQDPYLAYLLDRTKTAFGKVTLYRLLLPTNDITIVKKRQQLIRFFLDHPSVLKKIRLLLDDVAKVQNLLLSFWIHDPFKQTSSRYYFNYPILRALNDNLNTHYGILFLNAFLAHQNRFGHVAMLVAALAAPMLFYGYMSSNEEIPLFVKKLNNKLKHYGGKYLTTLLSFSENQILQDTARCATLSLCLLELKPSFEWARDNLFFMKLLQERLIHVRRFFDHACICKRIIKDHPALDQLLSLAQYMYPDKNDPHIGSTDFQHLLELLESKTFESEPSIFCHHGKVLAGFKLVDRVKEEIEPIIASIAQLDAYTALTTLFQEHQHKAAHFCFAEFIDDVKPSIQLSAFWNPFIDAGQVVTNDAFFGNTVPNNAIITGPNAGGKSTIIKGAFICVLCAQSIGIVPASRCIMTPFSYMATYLNIIDDIVAGTSLFKAEVMRTRALLERISQFEQNQFSFIIMDEIFSGTNPKEGEIGAFSVAKHIGTFDNVICLIATHYQLLTQLTNSDNYANYCVSVQKRSGRFHYPFKFESGPSDQHVAIDILQQEGFEGDILDTAHTLLSEA